MVADMPADERKTRWCELFLVLTVSGLAGGLANLLEWSSPFRVTATQSVGPVGVLGSVLTWMVGPVTVLYVLKCQGRTFRDISHFEKRDLMVGTLVLIAVTLLAFFISHQLPSLNNFKQLLWYNDWNVWEAKSRFQQNYLTNQTAVVVGMLYATFYRMALAFCLIYAVSELRDLLNTRYAVAFAALALCLTAESFPFGILLGTVGLGLAYWGLKQRRLVLILFLMLVPEAVKLYINLSAMLQIRS